MCSTFVLTGKGLDGRDDTLKPLDGRQTGPLTGRRLRLLCLPTHAVEGVTKALLSRMTNVKAGRNEGAAFTSLFIDDALRRTRWKVHSLEGR